MDIGSAIGGAVGSVVSAVTASHNMKRQYKYNKKLQEQSADLQQRNWQLQFDAQNEYNTPTAQRNRIEAAGMNPNLAYGNQWASTPVTAASGHPASVSQADYSGMARGLDMMAQNLNFLRQKAEIENIDADTKLKQEDAKDKEETRPSRIRLSFSEASFHYVHSQVLRDAQHELEQHNAAERNYWQGILDNKKVELDILNENIEQTKRSNDIREQEVKNNFELGMKSVTAALINAGANSQQAQAAAIVAKATAQKLYWESQNTKVDALRNKSLYDFQTTPSGFSFRLPDGKFYHMNYLELAERYLKLEPHKQYQLADLASKAQAAKITQQDNGLLEFIFDSVFGGDASLLNYVSNIFSAGASVGFKK